MVGILGGLIESQHTAIEVNERNTWDAADILLVEIFLRANDVLILRFLHIYR